MTSTKILLLQNTTDQPNALQPFASVYNTNAMSKQTDVSNEKGVLSYHQILTTNTTRKVWESERRLCILILRI